MPQEVAEGLTPRVAAEIRAEMARQGVSQRQIGEVLGISQPQVSKRLLGEVAFNTTELEKVAEFLGVPVTNFMHTPERAA
jgi:transcriptional regulator with XRE-family HTH domain